ncbi:MAG: indolepyruvate oxidoreductase subunit beta [Elusimicrobiota bacterium]
MTTTNIKVTNILFSGVGGQGIILGSDIISLAAMYSGFDAKKSEIHGMSQRGGSVFSHVRYGNKVYSPVIPEGQADILVALEEMESLRWLEYVSPKTAVVYVKYRVLPANIEKYPEGIDAELRARFAKVVAVDPKELTQKIGNQKYLNVAILGVIAEMLEGITSDAWKSAITALVPKSTDAANLAAFEIGKQI